MNTNLKIAVCITLLLLAGVVGIAYFNKTTPDLEGFAKLTAEDPLFYSPFFNHEAFSAATAELEASEDKLKLTALGNIERSEMPQAQKDQYIFLLNAHSLFPHAFLQSLPEAVQAHERFTADQSLDNAHTLLAAYERSAEAYAKAASSSLEVLKIVREHSKQPYLYFFTDSITSSSIVEDDYRLLSKNGQALIQEADRRKKCLEGRNNCAPQPNNGTHTDVFSQTAAEVFDPADPLNIFIKSTLPYAKYSQDVHGPFAVQTSCFDPKGSVQFMYLITAMINGKEIALPKLASRNYYRLIDAEATDHISKKVADMGLSFYSQAEGTTYECTDLSMYPYLLTHEFMSRNGKNTQLMENQFGLLAPALNSLSSYTDILERSQHISSDFVLSPQFLFSTRSGYSLTFMPFARSIWRITEKPAYLLSEEEESRIRSAERFVTQEELQAQGFTDVDIERSHLDQYEFIESLIRENNP